MTIMTDPTITFIGAGNMARSLIGGLITNGFEKSRIWATDPDADKCQKISEIFGINTSADNGQAVTNADIIILAVKPQVIGQVSRALAETISAPRKDRNVLVISVAAGILCEDLEDWLGKGTAIVRAMPNTPALVQCGATGLYANQYVTREQHDQAESILNAVGLTLWLEEEQMINAVTALSGSGPAYFFFFMEAIEAAGIELGLTAETSRLLTLQTALGAAKMAIESPDSTATLRQKVTSPGGTTERALQVLNDAKLHSTLENTLRAASDRAAELSKILGKSDG